MLSHIQRINMPYALSPRHLQSLSMFGLLVKGKETRMFLPHGNPHSFLKNSVLILSLRDEQQR